jgi:hypothetical protein
MEKTNLKMSTTKSVLEQIKDEDERIGDSLKFFVAVPHGDNYFGPAVYEHKKDPGIIDKMVYSKILTAQDAKPVVSITEEDVAIMDQKAWMAKLKDFNDWVGTVYSPQLNPANKALLNDIYPQFLQMQKEQVEKYHEEKKRIETIKLRGPTNLSELFTMYRYGFPNYGNAKIRDETIQAAMSDANAPGLGTAESPWVKTSSEQNHFQRGFLNARNAYATAQALGTGVLNERKGEGAPGPGTKFPGAAEFKRKDLSKYYTAGY